MLRRASVVEVGTPHYVWLPPPNGVDDTSAILSRLAEAEARQVPLLIPAGTYRTTGLDVTAWDGLRIFGEDTEASIIENINDDGTTACLSLKAPAGASIRSVSLEGFTLLGNAQSGNGLELNAGEPEVIGTGHFSRLVSRGHGLSGFRVHGYTDFMAWVNCFSRDNGVHGWHFEGTNLLSAHTLLSCVAGPNGDSGVYGTSMIGALNLIGCELGANDIGLHWTSANQTPRRLTVLGGRFEGNTTYQVKLYGGSLRGIYIANIDILDSKGLAEQIHVWDAKDVRFERIYASSMPDGGVLWAEYVNAQVSWLDCGVSGTGTVNVRKDAAGTLHNEGSGYILQSPDGTRYRLAVADDGTLSAEAV